MCQVNAKSDPKVGTQTEQGAVLMCARIRESFLEVEVEQGFQVKVAVLFYSCLSVHLGQWLLFSACAGLGGGPRLGAGPGLSCMEKREGTGKVHGGGWAPPW